MLKKIFGVMSSLLLVACAQTPIAPATGDLGVVIERATGSVQIVRHGAQPESLATISGLGDLSHATVSFRLQNIFVYAHRITNRY